MKRQLQARSVGRLTDRQRRFVEEYLVCLNATKAAITAGYSTRNASRIGPELLGKTWVAEAISAAMKGRSERTELTQDMVVDELRRLAFANMLDYITIHQDGSVVVDLSKVNRDRGAAIQDVTVDECVEGRGKEARAVKRTRFKLSDKARSLELLGRHLAMFTDNLKLNGELALRELSDEDLNTQLLEATRHLLADPTSRATLLNDPQLREFLRSESK